MSGRPAPEKLAPSGDATQGWIETPTSPERTGRVRLRSATETLNLRMGDEPPVLSGYGGWGEVERKRRKPLLDFQGAALLRLTLTLRVGSFADREPQGNTIRRLAEMASPGVDGEAPRPVKVAAKGVPSPAQIVDRWVIESLEWGAASFDERTGDRTQQDATIVLVELPGEDLVKVRDYCSAAKSKHKKITTRRDDTYRRIAKRYLGDARCWKRVRDHENNRKRAKVAGGRAKIKAGVKLRLP